MGDVARRFTMIRLADLVLAAPPLSHKPPPPPPPAADEGVSFLVVDRIGDIYRNLPRRADVIVTTVGARHKYQQDRKAKIPAQPLAAATCGSAPHCRAHECARLARWPREHDGTCASSRESGGRAWRGVCWPAAAHHGAVAHAGRAPAAREAAERCAPGRDIVRHGGTAARMAGRWSARERRIAWRTSSTWSAALVAAARAPLRRAIFMAAPPAGRRSGEFPVMS
ncbi:hypothetical protein F511_44358 [Dorcoceras hygrometricum]|uniref:Uncharacterized protein n=1 Tax=Dorcoceras hygrometricum TaxID=472368 RepID=A0A2Z6ZY31_9LAMI|nr:hypothetical protein F511_44358 [Dorcoceras hygrometricum]